MFCSSCTQHTSALLTLLMTASAADLETVQNLKLHVF